MNTEKLIRLVQYGMILILFTLAFLLPGYVMQEKEEKPSPAETDVEKTNVPEEKGTIVLDPGHGGIDPGVSGKSGIAERELNLVFAKKLAILLEQSGYRVVLTRETESGLYDEGQNNKKAQDMQRRCAVIERENPLLTISIHQNSYPDPSVCGPQVFYYEGSAEGEELATRIQDCMNEAAEIERPRLQKANSSYYILKHSAATAVLVEVGFLSCPEEEKKLQEEEYQNLAVQAICQGILRYLEKTA